jgi:uncharacterized protein YdeI (BOF family)
MLFRFSMLAAAAALALSSGSALAQSADVAKPSAKPAATQPASKAGVQPAAAAKSVNEAPKAKAETPVRATAPADTKSDGCHSKGSDADA